MNRFLFLLFVTHLAITVIAQELQWPPRLPGGNSIDSGTSPKLLQPKPSLRRGVKIAKTAPRIDFLYYPGQNYSGNPWSVWGESLCVGDKYYSAIGDHKAIDGNAFLFVFDSKTKKCGCWLSSARS